MKQSVQALIIEVHLLGLRVTRSGTLPLTARVRRTKQLHVIHSVDVCSFIGIWHLLHCFKAPELTRRTFSLAHEFFNAGRRAFAYRIMFIYTGIAGTIIGDLRKLTRQNENYGALY